jgi:group I intron endonuclease
MIGIYKITNPKGKIYVGKSINIDDRKRRYIISSQIKEQPKIYNSIQKYGWEQHKFEIIEECSLDQLNEREIYWISHYKCVEEGLNLKYGGEGGKHSVETKQKMRVIHLGKKKPWAIKTATDMGKSNKGKPKPIGFGHNISMTRSKPVLQYDLKGNFIKEWNSGIEAANFLGKPNGAISECLNKKAGRKSAYGFIWKFKN